MEGRVREGREGKGGWKGEGRGWEKGEGKGGGRDLAPPPRKKFLAPPLVLPVLWITSFAQNGQIQEAIQKRRTLIVTQ